MPDETVVSIEQPDLQPPPPEPIDTSVVEPAPNPNETPLDRMLSPRVAAIQEQVKARIESLETPSPAPAEPAPEPVVAPPAAPAPAPVAAAPAIAPVVVEPASVVAKPEPKEDFDWREFRRLKRLEKQLKSRGIDLDGATAPAASVPAPSPAAAAPALPPTDEDPFGVNRVAQSVQTIEQRQGQLEAQQENFRRQTIIAEQERIFLATQPDYPAARDYLVKWKQDEYVAIGKAAAYVPRYEKIYPNWTQAVEKCQDILSERENRFVSEEDAAQRLAAEILVSEDAEALIQSNLKAGKSVPEVVYALATQRSYQAAPAPIPAVTNGIASSAAAAPVAPAPTAVAEKVRQQAKVTAATKSSSNLASATATQGNAPPAITSLSQAMAYQQRDPDGYRAWTRGQEAQFGPRWYHKLAPS